MKKLIAILASLVLSLSAFAQSHYGVIGGLTFSDAPRVSELKDYKNATLYHAGLTYQYRFTLGFSIQPSVLYQVKGANMMSEGSVVKAVREGSVEIPVAFQWGPDLLLFRPYIEVVPFLGFNVYSSEGVNPDLMEGGIGLGGGIEIWKFQLSARYNWNFNPYTKAVEGSPEPWTFRCTTLSLAFMF